MKTTPPRVGIFGTILGDGFATVWIILWSAVTLTFDDALIRSLAIQVRAQGFHTTTGEIVASRVERHSDSDGTSYGVKVEYRFSVARQERRGEFNGLGELTIGSEGASRIVAQYPPGRRVTVYYNPRDPSQSTLRPGPAIGHAF